MYGVRHHLSDEFPHLSGTINTLKHADPQFAQLVFEYDIMDKKIYGLEQNSLPVADDYMEQLKKQRIQLKDRIYTRLLRMPR